MSKLNTLATLGFALTLAGGAFAFAAPANAQNAPHAQHVTGGYASAQHVFFDGRSHHTDPDPNIRFQLMRDCPIRAGNN